MQDHPVPSFDDPALKGALRRALDSETAPGSLRDRIRAIAAEQAPEAARPVMSYAASAAEPAPSAADASDRPIPLFRRPLYRFAAAAILLIGIGSLAFQIWNTNHPNTPAKYQFSNSLFKGMIATHEARATGAEQTPDTAKTLAEAPKLSQTLNRAVFVADLTKDGWTFDGAGVRGVGQYPAAQLFFTKGNAAISVFSLPASAAPNAVENSTYDTVFNGAPIAGYVHSGGLYCIVGSSPDGSLTAGEVKNLLERHKGELAKI
jgi:hypothetical protein